jgi:hypothetical protein
MDKLLARDIRHAIAETMTGSGRHWGSREDWLVGDALTRVSLPNNLEKQLEEARTELARVTSERDAARAALEQARRAAVAANRAAQLSAADAAALWGCLSALVARGLGGLLLPKDADAVQRVLVDHPGAALLTELETKTAELSDLRAHVERVFGAVESPSIVVRELLRRARK